MANYLLDTNVLLRAIYDDGSIHHQLAVNAISATILRGDELFITPQNMIEFWSVASRKPEANGLGWTVERVRIEIDRIVDQFTVLADSPEVFSSWLELTTRYRVVGRRVHDVRLVAVMLTYNINYLLTFNGKDFRQFSEVTIADPGQMGKD